MNDIAQRRARLTAWAALVVALLAALALLVLLIRNIPALLLVLVALVIVGAAGWVGLTRTGLVGILGLAVAVLALAGGVIVLFRQGVVDELLLFVAAFLGFGFLSSMAMRQSAASKTTSRVTESGSRPIRPGRRAVLLMNPKSGDGKPEKFHLVDEAKRRGIEPVLLQPGQDWRGIAREAAGRADIIGMAGGDGSQAMVAEIAMDLELPYVCVPAGTRNHLALDLGLDRDDIVGALDAFSSDIERCIDLAYVNDRIFVNNVSLGIYAEIVRSEAYRAAKMETMQQMLPELLGPDSVPFDLHFRGPEGERHDTAQLILVSNNPYQLDRLAGMGSRSRLDTGQLGIVTFDVANAAEAGELLALEAAGQVRRFRGWIEWSATDFEVNSGSRVALGIDGEAVSMNSPVRFRIVPAALHVHLPPSAPGLSPAALQPGLTVSGLRNLWRIAAGRD